MKFNSSLEEESQHGEFKKDEVKSLAIQTLTSFKF